MLPALLITFREVIEATLIVATIIGIMTRLKQFKALTYVWLAVLAAVALSVAFLGLGSLLGFQIQKIYSGKVEAFFEGTMMLVSAAFLTWAVFSLHKYFARRKLRFLRRVRHTVESQNQRGIFVLVFTAVLREGVEIVLFLSTIYLSTNPAQVFTGFGLGFLGAILLSALIFTTTIKLPVFRAFQVSTLLLILFAGGMAARGVHEFIELGIMPQFGSIILPLPGHFWGEIIKSIFGWSHSMDYVELAIYATYIAFMRWYVFMRPQETRVLASV